VGFSERAGASPDYTEIWKVEAKPPGASPAPGALGKRTEAHEKTGAGRSVVQWVRRCDGTHLSARFFLSKRGGTEYLFAVLFKAQSAAVFGIEAYLVEVEVDVGSAKMGDFIVVGLPDAAVKESRERIKAALNNCGFEFPSPRGVTINLAPADVRKEGSAFDLPMAMGHRCAPGWTYTAEVLIGGVVERSWIGLTGTSQTYTAVQRLANDPDLKKPVQFRIIQVNGSLSGRARTTDTLLMTS